MICGETLPPPLPRTSTISPSLPVCGIVELDELVQPLRPHVGDVDVGDLAAGGLRDPLDVAPHPVQVVQRVFVAGGNDHGLAAALRSAAGN